MSNLFHLNSENRRLLGMYVEQYQQTQNHINNLQTMLGEITNNINRIINQPRYHNHNHNHNQRNVYNVIQYDFNNPINRGIYRSTTNNMNDVFDDLFAGINNANTNTNNGFSTMFETFLSTPVSVRPSNEQIENATRRVRYGDIENPLSETCPISLERFNPDDNVVQIHHCGHVFNEDSFNNWFTDHVRCPVCRYDIRDYRGSNANTNNTNTNNTNTNNTNNTTNINNTNYTSRRRTNNRSLFDSITRQLLQSVMENDYVIDPSYSELR